MTWYVLYVKPKQEKKVAQNLKNIGVEVFCPMITEIRQWSDRKKKVELPLFKSYVFVRLPSTDRQVVFDVPGIVRYLFWLGQPAVVRDEEIQTIRQWLQDDRIDTLELSRLVPGKEIKIKKGPLINQKVVVKEISSKRLSMILKPLGIIVTAKIKDVL
ncbi:UpxY family transcription antiterminator [Pareuzebyella sediminis]|uniref:UpxY family transcription antiterminator n=1 Tax=Pareuzebyella sediminis TaxID=2607998 RepID=UPI0011F02CFE|nr:UpxY family transcription antiterminator [Pareuzebyella sediminis]